MGAPCPMVGAQFGLSPGSVRAQSGGGLARMLLGMFGDDHSLQFARGPDVSCRAHIDGLIKRAALDAECRIARRLAMPNARAAVGTKVAVERAAAVGGTAPALRAPARQGKGRGPDDHRNAERGGRLFAALGTMADVNLERL